MKKFSYKKLLMLSVLVVLSVGTIVYAYESYAVANGTSSSITEYGICKKITNNHLSGLALFVPTKTAAEWLSVYTNPPSGVSVGQCSATCSALAQFKQCTGTALATTQYTVFVLATGISQCKAFCENNVAGATCCEFRNQEGIQPTCRATDGGVVAGTYAYYSSSCI